MGLGVLSTRHDARHDVNDRRGGWHRNWGYTDTTRLHRSGAAAHMTRRRTTPTGKVDDAMGIKASESRGRAGKHEVATRELGTQTGRAGHSAT
jgi:hypothetical protein